MTLEERITALAQALGTDVKSINEALAAVPTITSGTAAPSGGSDGDIYLQYTA